MRIRTRFAVLIVLVVVFAAYAAAPVTITVTCPVSGNTPLVSPQSSRTQVATYTIQAPITNTGTVYFGGNNVSSSSTNGLYLLAGMAYTEPPQGNSAKWDVSQTYISCTVSADVVKVKY